MQPSPVSGMMDNYEIRIDSPAYFLSRAATHEQALAASESSESFDRPGQAAIFL